MKKYALTDEHIKNVKIFLQRTSLTGEEVSAFNQVVTILNQPIKDPAPEQVIKESPTDLLLNELQTRDDWDMSDICDAEDSEDVQSPEEIIEKVPEIKKPKKTYKVKKSSLMKTKG